MTTRRRQSISARATDLCDHGIAVYNGSMRCVMPWRDARTGRDYIYASIFATPALVVQLDPTTGRCRDFRLPAPCSGPWSMAFTMEGHLLVTSCCGRICRIDPVSGKVWVAANTGQWAWHIERCADGKFYIATSSECRLFRYDSVTDRLEDLGRLETAPGQKYLRSVVDGRDGYVYGTLGVAQGQVVAYHIASGRIAKLLPQADIGPTFPNLYRGRDGALYARAVTGRIYRIAHGQAFLHREFSREYGRLSGDEWFETVPAPLALPDGRAIRPLDPESVRIGEGRRARIFTLKYKTDGTNIFHLAAGPNKSVYASTIMPLYILRYTPATRKLVNLGRGGPDDGEAYSFGHCDGKLYYGTYSTGLLMCYDPAKPLHRDPPGAMKWKDNPRLITPLGKGHGRPRAMCVDSRKRVWVAGVPEYGARHGGLGCYDTRTGKYANNPVVIPDQSVWSLAADPSGDILYGGTTVARGSGMDPVTKEAHLFAWDIRRRKLLWKKIALPGVNGILNLLYHHGKLYGTTGSNYSFFRFDPATRKVDYNIPSQISACREQSLCLGPDGNIYGITWMVLFRWRPETGQIEELCRCMGDDAKPYGGSLFHRGAVIIGGRLYFSCGSHVMSMRIPLEKTVATG